MSIRYYACLSVSVCVSVCLYVCVSECLPFSGRMRTDATRSLPVITLTVTGEASINITLPFPSSTAWQWVEHRTELNIANTSAQLLVEISNTGAGQDSTPVYFDDLCLSLSGNNCSTIESIFYNLGFSKTIIVTHTLCLIVTDSHNLEHN